MASEIHFGLKTRSMTETLDLSIIIVNWKSKEFLRKCLVSIFQNTRGISFEVIVVDNASFDGCGEMLRAEFPPVKFRQCRDNLGFAGANNLAFHSSSGRALLFLNPDTAVVGSAIQTMWTVLQAAPDAGVVGCKLLNSDGTVQTSCIQRYPTILNQLLDSEQLRRLFPRAELWGIRPLLDGTTGPAQVEMISGACLMVSRKVFEQVGQFSTDYFMYAEDVDFCFKVERAGYRNYYLGNAMVIHHGGGSSDSASKNNFAAVVIRDSLWKFLRKYRGAGCAFAYRASQALNACLRILILLPGFTLASRSRRASLNLALAKWVKVFRWAIGLEAWVNELGLTRTDTLFEATTARHR